MMSVTFKMHNSIIASMEPELALALRRSEVMFASRRNALRNLGSVLLGAMTSSVKNLMLSSAFSLLGGLGRSLEHPSMWIL